MRNDIDERIFYWIRSTGIEAASIKDDAKGRRLRPKIMTIHKSLYHLRHVSKSPAMRRKHWKIIHEALGWILMDAAMFGLLRSENVALKMQEEILRNADKEMQLNHVTA